MGAMFGKSEKPEHEYYSRHQAIAGVFITAFYCLLFLSGVFEASTLALRIFAALSAIGMGIVGFRLVRSRVEVFERGIRVHNVFSTFELPWQEIARFGVGKWACCPTSA